MIRFLAMKPAALWVIGRINICKDRAMTKSNEKRSDGDQKESLANQPSFEEEGEGTVGWDRHMSTNQHTSTGGGRMMKQPSKKAYYTGNV